MIADTSEIVSILLKEPRWETVFEKLASSRTIGIGTPTLAETGMVLSARTGVDARGLVSRFMQEAGIIPIPFGEAHWREAVNAFLLFGKGRHPAALNFGDCMAYATARLAQLPLLCIGDDFAKTDLVLA